MSFSTHARSRVFTLGGLTFQTPLFMPVGTRACVRGQELDDLEALGYPILLANTYHLGLRPGPELLRTMGGAARWMAWPGGILTDSGGFQVFSLAEHCTVHEEGAAFASFDGAGKVLLTPERSMDWQNAIGSNIRMVMDQCVPSTASDAEALEAMDRTHRWALRSLAAHRAFDDGSALFAIVQGACNVEFRKQSAQFLADQNFQGFAIGGLAVGETRAQREDMTEFTAKLLPEDKPRYLMGVGTPLDLLEAIHRGVDMFDCILPTAMAQHRVAYTSRGKIDLKRGLYREADVPLDAECDCRVCQKYSRSYLHHLLRAGEPTGWQLMGRHNLAFYRRLMLEAGEAIRAGKYGDFYLPRREILGKVDIENPPVPTKINRRKRARDAISASGTFRLFQEDGDNWTVQETESGERMHPGGASEEAEALYVRQPDLKALLETEGPPLVIWDLGLGMASNAMAAVRCWDTCAPKRDFVIWSIDTSAEPLSLAARFQKKFPHLWHPFPVKLLKEKRVDSTHPLQGTQFQWNFVVGDMREEIARFPKPRLVFFDPFSHKSAPEMWTESVFRGIYDLTKDVPCELITYSNSTSVRTAILCAGFFVLKGDATGIKAETTTAVTPPLAGEKPEARFLDGEWLEKWNRSSAFAPPLDTSTRPDVEQRLRSHPQFTKTPAL